jgi:hypothetical protein
MFMDNKKDQDQKRTEEPKPSSSKQDELRDEDLDFSGGALVTAPCPKCNQNPCVCSNVV